MTEARTEAIGAPEFQMSAMTGATSQLPTQSDAEAPEIPLPMPKIPRYRIMQVLGIGGMGAVYEAEQEHPRRIVALKVIRPGLATRELLRRFAHEAEVLGRLQHPGIASIYESGTADSGQGPQPFFVMELVRGPGGRRAMSVADHVRQNRLEARRRLELVARIADAVHYAHQHGVIHRDLKPGNILVDEHGQPKILDFGVARVTDTDIQAATMQTSVGQIIGTLSYMSPEQAAGDPRLIDTRSDVYSLGVICYELLTGHLPHVLERKMLHEAVRIIREEEPSRLSSIDRMFRGDIEVIVAKAMDKEKERRYQSAGEFAADIRRYLNDEPIVARPANTWYQIVKLARRNKALVGGLAGVLLVLIVGVIATSWQAIRATHAEQTAKIHQGLAETSAAASESARRIAERRLGESLISQGDAFAAAQRVAAAKKLYAGAWDAFERGGTDTLLAELGAWHMERDQPSAAMIYAGHTKPVTGICVLPDGRSALSASEDQTIIHWDLVTGAQKRTLRGHQLGLMNTSGPLSVTASPDGRLAMSGGVDQVLRIWDLATGQQTRSLSGHRGWITRVAFSADGRYAVSCSRDSTIKLWDLASGNCTRTFEGHQGIVHSAALSPDGQRVLSAGADGTVRLWDVSSGRCLHTLRGDGDAVRHAVFLPDGRTALSGGADRVLRLWDLSEGKQIRTLSRHLGTVSSVAVSSNGIWGFSASTDQVVKLWRLGEETESLSYVGHDAPVDCASFVFSNSAALWGVGEMAISGGADGRVIMWELFGSRAQYEIILAAPDTQPDAQTRVALSPDGRMALAIIGKTIVLADLTTGMQLQRFTAHGSAIHNVRFLPDGRRALSCSEDFTIKLWDLATGSLIRRYINTLGAVRDVAVAPDGRTFLSAGVGRVMNLWDTETGECIRTYYYHDKGLKSVAYSPNGKVVASGSLDCTVKLWDLASGTCLQTLKGHDGYVNSVAFTHDGRLVISGATDNTVRFWDAASGNQLRVLTGHNSDVHRVVVLTGRNIVASLAGDGHMKLWDIDTGRELASRYVHPKAVYGTDLLPDMSRSVWGYLGGQVTVMDHGKARRRRELERRIPAAMEALQVNARDPTALAVMADWHAFGLRWKWALKLYEQARAAGADVPALQMARCYWFLSRPADARREFERALQRREAPEVYLRLCIGAIDRKNAATQPATAPGSRPSQ